jgi:hypothetical protein
MRYYRNARVSPEEWNFLEERLRELGFRFEVWSPGDGATRYQLVKPFSITDRRGGISKAFFVALGRREAYDQGMAFLDGWEEAMRRCREVRAF